MKKEIIGDCTLWLADCRDVMAEMEDKSVDAVVTDPPYGINAARERNSQKWGWTDFEVTGWDKQRPQKDCFDAFLRVGGSHIVWGGNYFTDYLFPAGKWLIWDKCQSDFSLADAELAWTSMDGAVRRIKYARSLALKDGRVHHTQKPIAVMKWCLSFLPDAKTIFDPFMGSGTTGVACVELGRKFIGVEIEERYFDIACKRIDMAERQGKLF